jgi:transposase
MTAPIKLARLTDDERLTLKEVLQQYRFADARRRAEGLLHLDAGDSVADVTKKMGVARETVIRWIEVWQTRGLIGVLGNRRGSAPRKLTKELLDTAERIARNSPFRLEHILRRMREIHPDAPIITPECLAIGLKRRGISISKRRIIIREEVDDDP